MKENTILTPEKYIRKEHDYFKFPQEYTPLTPIEIGLSFMLELMEEYRTYVNCQSRDRMEPEEFLNENGIEDMVLAMHDDGEWCYVTDVMKRYSEYYVGTTKLIDSTPEVGLPTIKLVECCQIGPITKHENYCPKCGKKIIR